MKMQNLYLKVDWYKNKAEIVTLEGTSHDFSEFNEENIKDVGINILSL